MLPAAVQTYYDHRYGRVSEQTVSAETSASAHTPAPPSGRAFAAIGTAVALTPLNSTMIAVALPAMSAGFGSAPSSVTVWVITAYLIATIVFQDRKSTRLNSSHT